MSDETTTPDSGSTGVTFETLARVRPLFTLNPETPEEEHFEFRLLEFDFGIVEHAEHQADSEEFDELWAKPNRKVCKDTGEAADLDGKCPEHGKTSCLKRGKLTAADAKRLKELLDRLFGRCLVKAAELQDRLTDEQKREVIGTFPYAPQLAKLLAAQQNTEKKDAETAESPSTTGS